MNSSSPLLPLMQREWLQYRNGWLLMAVLPLGLSLLLLSFGQIEIDGMSTKLNADSLPAVAAMAAIAVTIAVVFVIFWAASLIIVSGLARRDSSDRSIEFWLSLPTSHSASLGVPLLVHLILVPAAALLIGLLGGYAISLVLVGRISGLGAWLQLPWLTLIPASLAFTARLLAGLPLATLWLAPLILLVVLVTAWFRRWGWVILTVGLGLGSYLLKMLFGQPLLSQLTTSLLSHAGRAAIFSLEGGGYVVNDANDAVGALQHLPSWALSDLGHALQDLASPLLGGGLLVAAGCFWLLMQWRQRGGGSGG